MPTTKKKQPVTAPQSVPEQEAERVFRQFMASVTAYALAPRPGLFGDFAPEAVGAIELRRFLEQAAAFYDGIRAACR